MAIAIQDDIFRDVRIGLWVFVFALGLSVAFLSLLGLPHIEDGPGGFGILGAIPSLGVFVAAAVVCGTCWLKRPPPAHRTFRGLAGGALGYATCVAALIVFPETWGSYNLKIRIVDANHIPIPGITVAVLRQRAELGFIGTLIPDDVFSEDRTDKLGEVVVSANRHQHLGGLVNRRFIAYRGDGRPMNADYRFAGFDLFPTIGGKVICRIEWSKLGEVDNSNMHEKRLDAFEPRKALLTVFLPRVNGIDLFNDAMVHP